MTNGGFEFPWYLLTYFVGLGIGYMWGRSNRLAEIEAHPYTRLDLQHDEEEVYLAQDVRLLIRAVRQLGVIYKKAAAHEDATLDCNFMFYPDPDPEVVALLEDE